MRLRSRSPRSQAPADPFDRWTLVGNLDSPVRAHVDPAGRVHLPGTGWILDWWIGAEDRWHRPAEEAAVRQQLVGASPVVETRVRIPSGDAASRTYGARGPRGEDLLVVEVQNDSKVPVALAVAVDGALRDVALDGFALRVDGRSIFLPRSPGRVALSTATDDRSAADVVFAGDAEPVRRASVTCPDGGARGVLLFPLAHTATLRIAIALDGTTRDIELAELPSAPQVASGWAAHSGRAMRLELPDRRLREAISASVRYLLLAEDDPHPALETVAARWRMTGEPPAIDALGLAGLVQTWTTRDASEEGARPAGALPAIADLLDAVGEPRAAEDVRAIHRSHAPSTPADPFDLLATASATWTWATSHAGHDVAVNGALLLAVRDLVVREATDGLALSPVVPDAWLGLGWEVHDLPTSFGQLSFAIRWHGERPALLWELDPVEDGRPVRLTAPALDAAWSSTERRGEALLAPVPVPERPSQRRGLTIPVTIEPLRRRP